MQKPEYLNKLFSEIICCLSTSSKHIVDSCVLLRCGGHSCKKCAAQAKTKVKCNHCGKEHDGMNAVEIKTTIDLLIQSNYTEVFGHLTGVFNTKQQTMSEYHATILGFNCILLIFSRFDSKLI